MKIGDFLVASWGYDQTNIDFYKIVGITPSGKSVKIQKWSSAVAEDHGSAVRVVPGDAPSDPDAPIKTKRVRGDCVTINSYASAWLWNGKAQYQTGSGWGH